MRANERAYMAMLHEAVKHGRPTNYKFDLLDIDRAILGLWSIPEAPPYHALKEGRGFGWILRQHGTQFLHLCDSDREWVNDGKKSIEFYSDPMFISKDYPPLWYFWDGEFLHSCESGQALDNMATEHVIATILRSTM